VHAELIVRRGPPAALVPGGLTVTEPVAELARPTLSEIFLEHARYVGRVLAYLGVPDADVEDACQDVFIVVHRRLGDFRPGSSLRAWLYAICLRVASDRRQRAHVRREKVTAAPPEGTAGPTQHDALELEQARSILRRSLDDLDDDKRAVFVLYEIEELPMSEVAEAMGCPVQTAYSRLHAARDLVIAAVRRLESGGRPAGPGAPARADGPGGRRGVLR
jgi:RNA polymerase sigma-70 factor (ECF subfamily)